MEGLLVSGHELMTAFEAGNSYLSCTNVSGYKTNGTGYKGTNYSLANAKAFFIGGQTRRVAFRAVGRPVFVHLGDSFSIDLCLFHSFSPKCILGSVGRHRTFFLNRFRCSAIGAKIVSYFFATF
jgi:hypothetical protein